MWLSILSKQLNKAIRLWVLSQYCLCLTQDIIKEMRVTEALGGPMHLHFPHFLPGSGRTQLVMKDSYSLDSLFNYFHMEGEVLQAFPVLAYPVTAQGKSIVSSLVHTMEAQPITVPNLQTWSI